MSAKASDRFATYEVTKFSDREFAIRSSEKGSSKFNRKLGKLVRRTKAIVARTGHSNFVALRLPKATDATEQQVADFFARD